MIRIQFTGHQEKMAAANPYGLKSLPLYHQIRTVEALRLYQVVMNSYNTGTGKTIASLLYLCEMNAEQRDNVLFIAPTNELLHQHYEDICEFVSEQKLDFRPVEINAALLRTLGGDDVVDRGGERFVRLIRSNGQDFHEQLGIDPSDHRKLPLILVTNPDLFYYAFFWQFLHYDQRNLFQQFVRSFRYIVIDEFHYYNSKQLANFLFFIALSKEWGYFEAGRRICLLSATPDEKTRLYLDAIFDADGWSLVSPHNEPSESGELPTTSTLSPLTLHLRSGAIDDYAKESGQELRQRLLAGEHGALIANALARVNRSYDVLRTTLTENEMGRITGAQPVEQRRRDQFKPLILATPTVDIGYNFKKIDKPRQNLDFVIFEARFEDEGIQRMGRAGRVLGKIQTDIPSEAVGLVDEDTVSKLRPYDGQTISRAEFVALLRNTGALPMRDDFDAYVRGYGLLENAYVIFRMREIFPEERWGELEDLFERVRTIFTSQGGISYKGMVYHWKRIRAIESWLREPKSSYVRKWLPKLIADFQEWLTTERPSEKPIEQQLNRYLEHPTFLNGFRRYCEMEHERVRAQFSFRDSFRGPTASIFDPDHLLSGSDVTEYDVIHLVSNYHFSVLERNEFSQIAGQTPPEENLCVRLHTHRKERNPIYLRWQPPEISRSGWNKQSFERCFASGEPIALQGISLRAAEPPPQAVVNGLSDKYVLSLLIPRQLRGHLFSTIRHTDVYSWELVVDLDDGEETYDVILGTASLLVAPRMRWAFEQSQKEDEAIIL
jgi:CRISPR-associated endonuclease/helicase Cas3